MFDILYQPIAGFPVLQWLAAVVGISSVGILAYAITLPLGSPRFSWSNTGAAILIFAPLLEWPVFPGAELYLWGQGVVLFGTILSFTEIRVGRQTVPMMSVARKLINMGVVVTVMIIALIYRGLLPLGGEQWDRLTAMNWLVITGLAIVSVGFAYPRATLFFLGGLLILSGSLVTTVILFSRASPVVIPAAYALVNLMFTYNAGCALIAERRKLGTPHIVWDARG